MKTAVEVLIDQLTAIGQLEIPKGSNAVTLIIEQAKAMEKEQIKNSFVECWKANVPDGVECKLDAEQYYNETFKSE